MACLGTYFLGKLKNTQQSAWYMGLNNSSLQFGFIVMPQAGCYVEDEELKCVINRKTVITIKHKDDSCLWFALLACYHIGD